MTDENFRKGLLYSVITGFIVSLTPIVIISRPQVIDPYIFAAMTFIIVSFIFLPLVLLERKVIRKRIKNDPSSKESNELLLNGWKNHIRFFILLGFIFGVGRIFLIIGYELAGAINGALAQKARIIMALIFGYIVLKEKITKKQILFSIILFIGLFIAVSQFSFDLINLNNEIIIGVLILLLLGTIFTWAHTLKKKELFDKNEITPLFVVFIRNCIGGIILISTYFLFYPLENVRLFYEPINLFYFLAIGLIHGTGLFCLYKTYSYMDYSKATILIAPTPIITAVFAYFFLREIFTVYHLIGTIIIVISIVVIVREKPLKIK